MYMEFFYVLSEKEKGYSKRFEECGCAEGDKEQLIKKIKSNKKFCRDECGISYVYFVETLKNFNIIYVQDSDTKILGACSINLCPPTTILIQGICVPEGIIKGIGTILLNIVKCIGEKIHAKTISIYINKSVSGFYEKNGFVESSVKGGVMVCDRDLDGEDVSMIFNIPPPPRGGKRKTTSQKSKRKNKQRKITKKRNRISSKKRKYYRP